MKTVFIVSACFTLVLSTSPSWCEEPGHAAYYGSITLSTRQIEKTAQGLMDRTFALHGVVQNYSVQEDGEQAYLNLILPADGFSEMVAISDEYGSVKNTYFSSNDVRYQQFSLETQLSEIDTTIAVVDRMLKEGSAPPGALSQIRQQLVQQKASIEAQLVQLHESIGKMNLSVTIERSK